MPKVFANHAAVEPARGAPVAVNNPQDHRGAIERFARRSEGQVLNVGEDVFGVIVSVLLEMVDFVASNLVVRGEVERLFGCRALHAGKRHVCLPGVGESCWAEGQLDLLDGGTGGWNPEHAVSRFSRRAELAEPADDRIPRLLDLAVSAVVEMQAELQLVVGGLHIHPHGNLVFRARDVLQRAVPVQHEAVGRTADSGELLVPAHDRNRSLVRHEQGQAEILGQSCAGARSMPLALSTMRPIVPQCGPISNNTWLFSSTIGDSPARDTDPAKPVVRMAKTARQRDCDLERVMVSCPFRNSLSATGCRPGQPTDLVGNLQECVVLAAHFNVTVGILKFPFYWEKEAQIAQIF